MTANIGNLKKVINYNIFFPILNIKSLLDSNIRLSNVVSNL